VSDKPTIVGIITPAGTIYVDQEIAVAWNDEPLDIERLHDVKRGVPLVIVERSKKRRGVIDVERVLDEAGVRRGAARKATRRTRTR
jgi:hypothetical protein